MSIQACLVYQVPHADQHILARPVAAQLQHVLQHVSVPSTRGCNGVAASGQRLRCRAGSNWLPCCACLQLLKAAVQVANNQHSPARCERGREGGMQAVRQEVACGSSNGDGQRVFEHER